MMMNEPVIVSGSIEIDRFDFTFSTYSAAGLKDCRMVIDPMAELKSGIMDSDYESFDNFPEEINGDDELAFADFIIEQIKHAVMRDDFLEEVMFYPWDEDDNNDVSIGYDYSAILNMSYKDLYEKFKNG